jgi:hypothetical protein
MDCGDGAGHRAKDYFHSCLSVNIRRRSNSLKSWCRLSLQGPLTGILCLKIQRMSRQVCCWSGFGQEGKVKWSKALKRFTEGPMARRGVVGIEERAPMQPPEVTQ